MRPFSFSGEVRITEKASFGAYTGFVRYAAGGKEVAYRMPIGTSTGTRSYDGEGRLLRIEDPEDSTSTQVRWSGALVEGFTWFRGSAVEERSSLKYDAKGGLLAEVWTQNPRTATYDEPCSKVFEPFPPWKVPPDSARP